MIFPDLCEGESYDEEGDCFEITEDAIRTYCEENDLDYDTIDLKEDIADWDDIFYEC